MWGSGDEKTADDRPYYNHIFLAVTINYSSIIILSSSSSSPSLPLLLFYVLMMMMISTAPAFPLRPGWLQRRTPWVSGHLGSPWEMGHFWDATNYFVRKLVGIYFSIFLWNCYMCNTCNTCMIWGARFWHLKFGWSRFYISQEPCSTNPLTMKCACSQVHPHSASAFFAEISVYPDKYHTFSLQNVIPNVRRFSRLSTWECRFIPQLYKKYLQL